ncbi:MAG: ribosome maturation factor RimP [Clostridiales Family XIII bacterium]|jgi:ribosome maturation factor RimP|nr:ribosome maturation factor RimP [Clostridiales Family XIII bacterium]
MAKENLKTKIENLLIPFLLGEGIELWHHEYERAGDTKQLRIFIDKDGGIDLSEIEDASRKISSLLDDAYLIEEQYDLVVSSPGMDRPLLKDEHYKRYEGEPVDVSLYKGFEGRKKFSAILNGRTEEFLKVTPIDEFSLEKIGEDLQIPLDLVSKVNLKVVF